MIDRLKTHAPYALAIAALLALIALVSLSTGCSLADDYDGEDEGTRIEVNGDGNTVAGRDLSKPEPTPVPVATALPTVAP